MFSPLCPRPPSQLSINKHLSNSRCTTLIALGAEPGAPTFQFPTQKSSCRLSAFAAADGSAAADAIGWTKQSDAPTVAQPTIRQPDPIRLVLVSCFILDVWLKSAMAQDTSFDIIYLLCDKRLCGRTTRSRAFRLLRTPASIRAGRASQCTPMGRISSFTRAAA